MDLRAAFEQALSLDETGDVAAAVACLDEVIEAIPEWGDQLKFAGQLYQRLGADRQSFTLLTKALALAPDDPSLLLCIGYHHVDNGDIERALGFFRRHLELLPESQSGQLYLGRTLDWLGRLDEAEAALECAVALDPTAIEPYLQLGRVRLRRERLTAADEAFAVVQRLDPGNVLAEIGHRRVAALTAPKKPIPPQGPANTIVCVKAGTKYGPDYVNRLAAMVRRNSTRNLRIVCFTDDARGLAGDVEAQPLPAVGLTGWWNKVALFRETLSGVSGRVLYLDLDVVITGSLDPLLDHPGDPVVMDNDYVPGFNSSVMLFTVGARAEIWTGFSPETTKHIQGDQDWVALAAPDAELWPDGWCVPFRLRAAIAPPPETKVVVFSGRPNPDEYPAEWVRALWR